MLTLIRNIFNFLFGDNAVTPETRHAEALKQTLPQSFMPTQSSNIEEEGDDEGLYHYPHSEADDEAEDDDADLEEEEDDDDDEDDVPKYKGVVTTLGPAV